MRLLTVLKKNSKYTRQYTRWFAVARLGLPVIFLWAASHAFAQVPIPPTPPGTILQAWLDAINATDVGKMESYVKKYDANDSVRELQALQSQSGGFELIEVENSHPLWIQFRARAKASSNIVIGVIQVKKNQPSTVGAFDLRGIPRGTVLPSLDADTRRRVIEGLAGKVKDAYLVPETAQQISENLRIRLERGEYDTVTNGYALASLLTYAMQEISRDLHLRIRYSLANLPDPANGPTPEEQELQRKQLEQRNCGFEKVEILKGNTGYLKFNMFADPAICAPTAIAAMNFVSHVNALIFDLRENGGGEPTMIALITSYLFDQPTHLNDLYNPRANSTVQSWTSAFVPGNKIPRTPVYVLTSTSTFSGAEEFAYNLQSLKRATVVGETTAGGAHEISLHRVNDHFMATVPYVRAVNPITKTNWEATGVQPDVRVPASAALDTAQKLAGKPTANGPIDLR